MMQNISDRLEFSAEQCGSYIWPVLKGRSQGLVAAVFDRSFYVELDGHYICFENQSLDIGPLNLTTNAPAGVNWHAVGLIPGANVDVSNNFVCVGARLRFGLAEAVCWQPEQLSISWNATSVARGLASFRLRCRHRIPDDGLGCYIHPCREPERVDALDRMVSPAIVELGKWLACAFRADAETKTVDLRFGRYLFGAGPGLTPSGDDFFGGVMIALHALRQTGISQQLWGIAAQSARNHTHPLAFAHLAAAAEGQGSRGLHAALAIIMQGRSDDVSDAADGIDQIGHTSGWDTMAGIALVLDVWSEMASNDPTFKRL